MTEHSEVGVFRSISEQIVDDKVHFDIIDHPFQVIPLYGMVRQTGHSIPLVELQIAEAKVGGSSLQARGWADLIQLHMQAAFTDASVVSWEMEGMEEAVMDDLKARLFAHMQEKRQSFGLEAQQAVCTQGALYVETVAANLPLVGITMMQAGQPPRQFLMTAVHAFNIARSLMDRAQVAELQGAVVRFLETSMKMEPGQVQAVMIDILKQQQGVLRDVQAFQDWMVLHHLDQGEVTPPAGERGPAP